MEMHTYEVRPRKDKRGVALISDVLPFGQSDSRHNRCSHRTRLGLIAASCMSNFCKAKGKEGGALDPLSSYKGQKGANYGIPDSSCCRISGGVLRADHHRLPETA